MLAPLELKDWQPKSRPLYQGTLHLKQGKYGDPGTYDETRAAQPQGYKLQKGDAMNKQVKRLQKLLTEGKLTAEEYATDLKELLDDEIIQQADFDGAKDFEPEDEDNKPVYTQEDFNRQLLPKARKMVKKALTDAGVNLDDVEPKDLLTTFASLAVQGQKKGSLSVDEEEVNSLQKKAKQLDTLQAKVKNLSMENAVLKAAGAYNPLNPKQVVRALGDYADLLEYDEEDNLVAKSVDKAIKKLAEAEPNLFHAKADDEDEDKKDGFNGKPPGGAGQGTSKEQQKHAATRDKALALLNIKPENKN